MLISAPAGYGKTTLAAEWTAACGWPTAWLTLDEGDNDLARFLACLVVSLQKVEGGLGQATAVALQTRPPPPPVVLLPPLLNGIYTLSQDVLLILYDCRQAEAKAIHHVVTFLIDHQPPPLHLVMVTRADPPRPIARLRASGQLTELRQADLGFTGDEAADLFRQMLGRDLPPSQVTTLLARTEGRASTRATPPSTR